MVLSFVTTVHIITDIYAAINVPKHHNHQGSKHHDHDITAPLIKVEGPAVRESHDLRVRGEGAPVHGAGPHCHVLARV